MGPAAGTISRTAMRKMYIGHNLDRKVVFKRGGFYSRHAFL